MEYLFFNLPFVHLPESLCSIILVLSFVHLFAFFANFD